MHLRYIRLVAGQEMRSIFRTKIPFVLYGMLISMLVLAGWLGWSYVVKFNGQQARYTQEVLDNWMNQPNRHPHRVAHYGYLVFREKSPLSFFDFGLDSYLGNSVFLEAHRQNTVNMSEAGFSSGMLRFGELSMAMVMQLLVPLFIIFLGFSTVAGLKQNGVLKLLLCQKASFFDVLLGKTLGLTLVPWFLFLPLIFIALLAGTSSLFGEITGNILLRIVMIGSVYAAYFLVISMVVVCVSVMSKTPANALVSLVLIWMVSFIVIPKSAQTLGANLFHAPDKIGFETAVEDEVRLEGDSHNPDDPHFIQLRTNTLKKYGVDSIQQLPVNYGALVMQEGERISSGIFGKHFDQLIQTYRLQNNVAVALGFIDPYLSVRNLSMSLCGVDFETFAAFQKQTEQYRFDKTSRLNQIHLTQIDYKTDRSQKVDRKNWQQQPPFQFKPIRLPGILAQAKWSLFSLLFWMVAGLAALRLVSTVRKYQL